MHFCHRGRAYSKYEFLLNYIKNVQNKNLSEIYPEKSARHSGLTP